MKEHGPRRWPIHVFAVLLCAAMTLPTAGQVSARAAGNSIEYFVPATANSDTSYCVVEIVLDGHSVRSTGTAPPCRSTPFRDGTLPCNWTGAHVIAAFARSPTGPPIPLGEATVTVTQPPPNTCNMEAPEIRFDIANATAERDRRVLLSNMNTNGGSPRHPYPRIQGLLSKDKVIPIGLRTIYDSAATSGIPVTLKVIDPADPSPYVAGGPGIVQPVPGSEPNDNAGPLPKLKGTGLTDNGSGTYSIVSGDNGYISVEMELDAGARAGDNYQVVATATFPNNLVKSATSGSITAWKRLFVEKRQMYRRGLPLATNAPAGVTSIVVRAEPIASSGVDAFARNDYVRLEHAPAFGEPKNPGAFYSGLYQIIARPRRFRAGRLERGPGLITTNGTNAIVGNGTRFARLNVGDVINIPTSMGLEEPRVILTITDNTNLTVDTPPTTLAADLPYTIGDPYLVPGTYYRRLQLDRALTESYAREPRVAIGSADLSLNDGVVYLGAGDAQPDFFDVNHESLVGSSAEPWNKAFPSAYTEYVVLANPGAGARPVPRRLLSGAAKNSQRFIDKWFGLPAPVPLPSTDADPLNYYLYHVTPNHQLLLVGDSEPPGAAALQNSNGFHLPWVSGERASVLNRGVVEHHVTSSNSPLYGADPDTVLSRTLVHEMVHQWDANGGSGSTYKDHCHPQVAYDSQQPYPSASGTPPPGLRFCLMSWPGWPAPEMPAPWSSSDMIPMVMYLYRDGATSLHITGDSAPHSEYLSIRSRPDPWTP